MHHLQRISVAMAVVGVALVAIALIANLAALWTLTGLLLAWAGIVKIVITLVWSRVAHMGTDDHQPTPSP